MSFCAFVLAVFGIAAAAQHFGFRACKCSVLFLYPWPGFFSQFEPRLSLNFIPLVTACVLFVLVLVRRLGSRGLFVLCVFVLFVFVVNAVQRRSCGTLVGLMLRHCLLLLLLVSALFPFVRRIFFSIAGLTICIILTRRQRPRTAKSKTAS